MNYAQAAYGSIVAVSGLWVIARLPLQYMPIGIMMVVHGYWVSMV